MNRTREPGRGIDGHLPLTPVVFEILLALADGELHGYAILQSVDARSSGRIKLLPGSLYRALTRLLDDGLVAQVKRRAGDDPRRRSYRLTSLGRRVLIAEGERLAVLVRAVRGKQLLQPDRA